GNRVLNLDDISTLHREKIRTRRSCQHLTEIENAQSGERVRHDPNPLMI
ncbi:MAG: hypothetical protein ACI89J_004298, partial [Hyphomicrobiaceae bacterium]